MYLMTRPIKLKQNQEARNLGQLALGAGVRAQGEEPSTHADRCRANMAQIRQLRPDSGLGLIWPWLSYEIR